MTRSSATKPKYSPYATFATAQFCRMVGALKAPINILFETKPPTNLLSFTLQTADLLFPSKRSDGPDIARLG